MSANTQLATAYAALLLHDSGVAITAANISNVLKAAKVNGSDSIARVFEETLKTSPITNFIGCVGGSAAPAAASAPAATSAPAKKEEPKKEEPKEPEEDLDMGDLFG